MKFWEWFIRTFFYNPPVTLEESVEDLERLLRAVAGSQCEEQGKDPERAAEKYVQMDKNGQ